MKALIDTQIFLWMAVSPDKLSPAARSACETGELILSVASAWEIGIKHQIGKLDLPASPKAFLDAQIRMANVAVLPIHYRHAMRAAALESPHKDPFDRLIAAQAIEEGISCISSNVAIEQLGARRIW